MKDLLYKLKLWWFFLTGDFSLTEEEGTLDIRDEKTKALTRKVNYLVSKMDDLPSRLIITSEQYEYLHRRIEVFYGDDKVPVEFLFHGKWNIMEVEIR